jgi:apolipoprotein N-acyltransferase
MRFIVQLAGWRRNLFAFVLGVCATLTLAPFYFFPLIIPAYGGLLILVQSAKSRKRAFADGWWWGWGFYISGLYWFCVALLTEPEKFAWAIPFSLFGLNAIIAIYQGIACWLFYLFMGKNVIPCEVEGSLQNNQKNNDEILRLHLRFAQDDKLLNIANCLAFSLIWLLIEYARGHLFSGFPWNLAGYSFAFSDASLQLASIFGAYLLTFFAVLLGASATLIRTNKVFVLSVWGVFAGLVIWGNLRLDNAVEGEKTGAVLRLVQANILQPHKWDPKLQQQNLEEYIKLTRSDGLEKITHVIWPETATPFVLRSDTSLAYGLGKMLPEGATLITGALRSDGEGEDRQYYNSVVMIDNGGFIIGNYDKHALVPFGEFLPLRFLIPKSLKLPVGDKDFSEGDGVKTLKWQGLPPVSVLVCYEGIFPEYAVDNNNRPEWMLNVTNDAWFGMSTGPYQHFAMSRMRSVEQGMPLVRVANTGITAYIDEFGRIREQMGLETKGILDVSLSRSTLNGTIYTTYDRIIGFITICFSIIFLVYCKKLMKN